MFAQTREVNWTFNSCLLGCNRWSELTSLHDLKKCFHVFISDWKRMWAPPDRSFFNFMALHSRRWVILFHMDMITLNLVFFFFFLIPLKQLDHCKYLTGCLWYQGLVLKERMIKIQACVQTSHINFGKRILAERTHCVLNVLLPLNTITHCYKNPHNVRTKISLWLIFTTSITDFSRQEAVNATLHHVSLFFPVKHLIMYLHALCANFFSHCPFIWENFMINIWIRNSRIPSQKYMFSVLFWFELLWFGDNDWRYVFFCYNGTRQHSARGAPQKNPKQICDSKSTTMSLYRNHDLSTNLVLTS